MLHIKNGKIYITRRNMQRIMHGTHTCWEVLVKEGALAICARSNGSGMTHVVNRGDNPSGEVVGIEDPGTGQQYMSTWTKKFVVVNPLASDDFQFRELRISGLPSIAVREPQIKGLRKGR